LYVGRRTQCEGRANRERRCTNWEIVPTSRRRPPYDAGVIRRMPPAPDVPGIVRAIEATGLSRRQIAKRIGVAPATVCAWVTELRVPTYRHGAALVELAQQQQSATPTVPRETVASVQPLYTSQPPSGGKIKI